MCPNNFNKSALQYLQLNYASSSVKVDSQTFISFEENYQTSEKNFYSYHVIPLNKTMINVFVNCSFFPFNSLMLLFLLKFHVFTE